MSIIIEKKEIPYNAQLTIEALEKHANGYLRYQNFSDLVAQGPEAVTAYIKRANQLFRKNIKKEFSQEAANISDLDLSYMTIFFRDSKEAQEDALPMTDFLKFKFNDAGTTKEGFGIFFSSYGRESDRNQLESGAIENINTSVSIYKSMFKEQFEGGVLDGYPIMTMRQTKSDDTNDPLHQYYSLLGTNLETIHPDGCPGKLRCYHHGNWQDIDPKIRIAAISLGQAMQEFIRTEEYRAPHDPETSSLPVFDWGKQGQVKTTQQKQAVNWFENHAEGIKDLLDKFMHKSDTVGTIESIDLSQRPHQQL